MIKLLSWNVNGIRAVANKGFVEYIESEDPDIFCLQEIKATEDQIPFSLDKYNKYINSAVRKGYSGTAVYSKLKPINVSYGIGIPEHDDEGRVITLEFEEYYIITCYTPNSKNELKRLDYRMEWEDAFRNYLVELDKKKPLMLCGDLNVAHKEIDIKNPKTNHRNAGFTDEERNKFTQLLEAGFTDSFRYFYPKLEFAYSWWSYRFKCREKNIGWRIDYWIVSNRLINNIVDSSIESDIVGSDHCPVILYFDNKHM